MALFAMALFVLSTLLCAAMALPLTTEILEKRITHSGRGTWFEVGQGACGEWNVDADKIVAISSAIYGSGANCNQWMHITNTDNGKTAYGLVRDECPSCSAGSIDMSPSLFQELGTLDQGVLQVSWHYEAKGFSP